MSSSRDSLVRWIWFCIYVIISVSKSASETTGAWDLRTLCLRTQWHCPLHLCSFEILNDTATVTNGRVAYHQAHKLLVPLVYDTKKNHYLDLKLLVSLKSVILPLFVLCFSVLFLGKSVSHIHVRVE